MASRKTVASNNQNDNSAKLLSQRNPLRSTHAPGGMKNAWEEAAVTFCTAWSRSSCSQSIAEMWSFVLPPEKKNITETFNSPSSMPEAIPREQWLSNMGFNNSSRPQEHIVYWQSYPLLEFRILSFIFQVWSSAAGSHTTDQRLHVIGPFILCSKAAWYPLVGITAAVFSSQQQTLCFMPVCVCFHCAVM